MAHSPPKIVQPSMSIKTADETDFPVFQSPHILPKDVHNDSNGQVSPSGNREGYKFSVGQLPAWAKKQVEILLLSDKYLKGMCQEDDVYFLCFRVLQKCDCKDTRTCYFDVFHHLDSNYHNQMYSNVYLLEVKLL